MLYRVAQRASDRLPEAFDTALVKYLCNEAGFFAANESMQVLGALGYSEESLVEYCWWRPRGWQIAGGSLEMMRNRIAEGVFGRSFSQRPPKRSARESRCPLRIPAQCLTPLYSEEAGEGKE